MKTFRYVAALAAVLFTFLTGTAAYAQTAEVVSACGAQSLPISPVFNSGFYMDSAGQLCVAATVSASISPFTPGASGARGTPFTVTSADSSGNLPTNAGAVVVSNPGANLMYCNVNGAAATASDQPITSGGGWFNFGIPTGVTVLHCIAPGGNTTANMVGGSGLATGTGGGGGGSGGAVSLASAAPVPSTAAEATHVLKASAGILYSLDVTIGVTTGWVMIFDATTAPADGAVTPKFCRYIKSDGTGGATSLAWFNPLSFATGISVAFSSTGCFTKTASATAFFEGAVQ